MTTIFILDKKYNIFYANKFSVIFFKKNIGQKFSIGLITKTSNAQNNFF